MTRRDRLCKRLRRLAGQLGAAGMIGLLASVAHGEAPRPDPNKVLRIEFPVAETGFDPAQVHDLYSNIVIEAMFEPLLTYDYLARPAKLAPRAAAALPEIAEGGRVYTFHLPSGILFADDPAFGGRRRELTAEDYVYSIKRLADPKLHSPWRYLVEDKIAGLAALIKAAEKSGRFDYGAKVPGLATPDRYTLRVTLDAPDLNYPYILAMPAFGAVAREAVERYGADIMAHPVGTGPYRLDKWQRSARIELAANANYRGHVWNFTAQEPADQLLVDAMRGKVLPTIGRVEIAIMEEDQARLLAFQNGELDLFNLEGPLAPRVLDGDRLKPEFVARGAKLSRIVDPEIQYPYFSMRHPVLGGLSKEKIALRRALALAYDDAEEIRVVHNGQATQLQYPVPPGVVGYLPGYRSSNRTDVPLANALLDRFGYKVGADGWRTTPQGAPLAVTFTSRPDSLGRQQEEMWQKTFAALKIRMLSDKKKFPEILKAEKTCQLQMRSDRWIADFPDGENFMQLFYSKNIGQSNTSCTDIPEYDALYEKASRLPPGAERDALWVDMARLLEYYGALRISMARNRNMVMQKYVVGYKKHPILLADWLYADIDLALKDTP
jgi:ABC-type transport system substrate-binding protein